MYHLTFRSTDKRGALCSISTYSRIIRSRVLAPFDDGIIEQEAKTAADTFFDKHLNQLATEDDGPDEGEIADDTDDLAQSVYSDLRFVGDHVTTLAIAGIYHLWECAVKELLELQFTDPSNSYISISKLRTKDFKGIVKIFTDFGWKIRDADFYDELDTARLVANIAKHGDGDSCEKLIKKLDAQGKVSGMFRNTFRLNKVPLSARNLALSQKHFLNAADAVTKFFIQFPEQLSANGVEQSR